MKSLKSMSLDDLIALRHDVGRMLDKHAAAIRDQLAKVENGAAAPLPSRSRKASRKGRRAPIKYRNPKNRTQVWSGRGRRPLWLVPLLKAGRKLASFEV